MQLFAEIGTDGWVAIVSAMGASIVIPLVNSILNHRKEQARIVREELEKRDILERERVALERAERRARLQARRLKKSTDEVKTELKHSTTAAVIKAEELSDRVEIIHKATNSIKDELTKETRGIAFAVSEKTQKGKESLLPVLEDIKHNTQAIDENTKR